LSAYGELARQSTAMRQLANATCASSASTIRRRAEEAGRARTWPAPGRLGAAVEDIQRGDVDEVVAMPWSQEKRIREILRSLAALSINVRICPMFFTLYLRCAA